MPTSQDNHRKASYSKMQQRDQVQVDTRSCDQGRFKNDAFILSATLPTISVINKFCFFLDMEISPTKEEEGNLLISNACCGFASNLIIEDITNRVDTL